MPEHLRALIFILALSGLVWIIAANRRIALPIAPDDYSRRRNAWFAVILCAFLAHNVWLFALLLLLIVTIARQKEGNPLALYFVCLFAIPPLGTIVPGFGIMNYLLALDVPRMLALFLLLPVAFHLSTQPGTPRLGSFWPDRFVLGYVAVYLGAQLVNDSFTNALREGLVGPFIDIVLPYYVASRSLRNVQQFKDLFATVLVVALALALIALFENLRGWLLYSSLDVALGVFFPYGHYLVRGEGGGLRAQASMGHSIVLGYLLIITLTFMALLWPRTSASPIGARSRAGGVSSRTRSMDAGRPSRWPWIAAALVLGAGLAASLSRGPWVGGAVALVVLLLTGPKKGSRLVLLAAGTVAAGVVLSGTQFGQRIIALLPFIGTVDAFNVSYRQRLFDISIDVILQRPFFGSLTFMSHPMLEELRQGEGIIDIVNSYLGIALRNGLVALALFAGAFISGLWGVWMSLRKLDAQQQPETVLLGRVLLAATCGALVTIATVSSILTVPHVYWALAGFAVAYRQITAPQAVRQQVGARARSYARTASR